MIIWLATYPRAGNHLLRSVLSKSLGLCSYSQYDEPAVPDSEAERLVGSKRYEGSFSAFYKWASAQDEPVLIKTHDPPRDNQPAIYVVRDGRLAVNSLYKFERATNKSLDFSLIQLIMGCHTFGDWSSHYRRWHNRQDGRLLTVRFNDLVHPHSETLERLQNFVMNRGVISQFENPRARLAEIAPDIVGEGRLHWQPTPEWDSAIDFLFWRAHGDLMRELQFADEPAFNFSSAQLHAIISCYTEEMLAWSSTGLAECNRTLSERLELIETLTYQCRQRGRRIGQLALLSHERLEIIKELSGSPVYRVMSVLGKKRKSIRTLPARSI